MGVQRYRISLCPTQSLMSGRSEWVRYWVEHKKFHTSKQPCIILFVQQLYTKKKKLTKLFMF